MVKNNLEKPILERTPVTKKKAVQSESAKNIFDNVKIQILSTPSFKHNSAIKSPSEAKKDDIMSVFHNKIKRSFSERNINIVHNRRQSPLEKQISESTFPKILMKSHDKSTKSTERVENSNKEKIESKIK